MPIATQQAITMYQTMTEIATRFIRERVLAGDYKPGSRLIPAKLEGELGLGRVAIREALRELAGSGMVVSMPNKGVIVADAPAPEEIAALYEARYALEGGAAYLAAKNMTPAVIGIPDDTWGEAVCAVVVFKEGKKATEEEIIDPVKSKLASYKKPKKVEVVDAIPRTLSGKILKKDLPKKYWEGKDRKV